MTRLIKNNFIKLSLIAGIFILNSCGLDEYYVVDPPTQGEHVAPEDTSDRIIQYENRYFEFKTDSNSSLSSCEVYTLVYYKIYNNYNTCINEKSRIASLLNSETSKGNTYSTITSSYGYQRLNLLQSGSEPSIGSNARVYIRLTQYYDSDVYIPEIKVNGNVVGKPGRYSVNNASFDFSRNSTSYPSFTAPLPVSGDTDYNSGTSTKDGLYYVTMYAVTIAQDPSFVLYYSPILYLGTLSLDSTSYDN